MADEDAGRVDDRVVRLAEAIHRFVRANPHHYAVRALDAVVARQAAGERVASDERMLALASIVAALRERR